MSRNEYNRFGTEFNAEVPFGHTVSPSTPADDVLHSREDSGLDWRLDAYIRTQEASAAADIGETEIDDEFSVGAETLRPVVGWLVCIQGVCKGKDFRLHSDRNYIGRSNGGNKMDVDIPDSKITRGANIQIAYDPVSRGFYAAACTGVQQNSYYNGRLLMGDREMKAGDRLKLGATELIFVPLCGENFVWEDGEQK